jgi:sugar O-acyltransferase (sialic acid O-acetyltransferase NeuD family)
MKKIFLTGFGGFSREVFWYAKELEENLEVKIMGFIEKFPDGLTCQIKNYYSEAPIINENIFDYSNKNVVICTGDPLLREKIYKNIIDKFTNVSFPNIISPSAKITGKETMIFGQGIIISSGCRLTCDITLGDFVNLNILATIGHDSVLDKFITLSPGVNISGNVSIGKNSFLGTNSCVLENIRICSDVIIGAGAVVVKDIEESGVYVGIPAKKVK